MVAVAEVSVGADAVAVPVAVPTEIGNSTARN